MSDIQASDKAFRGEIIREMVISSRRFGIEDEATAKGSKLGCRIYEVPISYYGRTFEEGKKIGFIDSPQKGSTHVVTSMMRARRLRTKRRSGSRKLIPSTGRTS